jgi:hypothetical protein
MSTRKLGDIPLDDYLHWVGRRRPWRRPLKLLGLVVLCGCSMAAGALGPWSGRGTGERPLEDALTILVSPDATEADLRRAIFVVQVKSTEALEQLRTAARAPGLAGEDASRSLRHLTRRGIDCIKKLAEQSDLSAIHERSLELIRGDLAK